MSDNSMNFELKLKTDEFDKSIASASKAVDNFSSSNGNLAEVLGDVESSLEDNVKVYKDFDKQLKSTKGNTDNLAKAFKDELDKLKDLSKETNKSSNAINNFSNATKDIEKNSKAGNLALEAIKDNLGSIPVIGPTATRALEGLEGSFSKLVLAGAGVGAVAGAVAGVGAAIYGAYTQSEKFRDSIEDFKANAAVAFSPVLDTLEKIGNTFGTIIDNVNELMKINNAASGANIKASQEMVNKIVSSLDELEKKRNENLEKIKSKYKDEAIILRENERVNLEYTESLKKIANDGYDIVYKRTKDIPNEITEISDSITEVKEELKNLNPIMLNYETEVVRLTKKENDLEAALINKKNELTITEEALSKLSPIVQNVENDLDKLTGTTKKEISEYEKLTQSLAAVIEVRNAEAKIIEDNYAGKEKEIEAIKANINALEQQKQLITSYYTEAKKQGKDYYDESLQGIIAQINGNEEVTGSVEDLGKALQKINELIAEQKDKYTELTKPLLDVKAIASQIMSSIQSAYNSISSAVMSIKSYDLIDTSKFDEQIEHIQNKIDEFDEAQKEKEEEKQELDDEEYEAYLARLDEEYQKAVEANDLMSQEAIRIKKEELQKKKEEEKKELEEEKKINEEREELERQLAEAQYNKDYAEWQNQVKLAELQKNKAIADAVILPALATAQSALGLATSFAQGGPVGFAAGVALSATAIGTAVGAAAGVASAASALDNVKSNPPEMPKFEFGTTGYTLGYGETALVGERGAELVKNMGGILQVQSAAQTQASGGSEKIGMYIENLIFQVTQKLTADEIYNFMNSFKARNIRFRR